MSVAETSTPWIRVAKRATSQQPAGTSSSNGESNRNVDAAQPQATPLADVSKSSNNREKQQQQPSQRDRSPLQEKGKNGATDTANNTNKKAAGTSTSRSSSGPAKKPAGKQLPSYSPVAEPGTAPLPPPKKSSSSSADGTKKKSNNKKPTALDQQSASTAPTIAATVSRTASPQKNQVPTIVFVDVADVVKPKRGNTNRSSKSKSLPEDAKTSTADGRKMVVNRNHADAFLDVVEVLVSQDKNLERTLIVPTFKERDEQEEAEVGDGDVQDEKKKVTTTSSSAVTIKKEKAESKKIEEQKKSAQEEEKEDKPLSWAQRAKSSEPKKPPTAAATATLPSLGEASSSSPTSADGKDKKIIKDEDQAAPSGGKRKRTRRTKKKIECATNSERQQWLALVMKQLSAECSSRFKAVRDRSREISPPPVSALRGREAKPATAPADKNKSEVSPTSAPVASGSSGMSYREKLMSRSPAAARESNPANSTTTTTAPAPTPAAAKKHLSFAEAHESDKMVDGSLVVDWAGRGVNLDDSIGLPVVAPGVWCSSNPKEWFEANKSHITPSTCSWVSITAVADPVAEASEMSPAFKKKVVAGSGKSSSPSSVEDLEAQAMNLLQESYGSHFVLVNTSIISSATTSDGSPDEKKDASTAAATPITAAAGIENGLKKGKHLDQLRHALDLVVCAPRRNQSAEKSENPNGRSNSAQSKADSETGSVASKGSHHSAISAGGRSITSANGVIAMNQQLIGQTLTGTVKRYNPARGFGFLHCKQSPTGPLDVFVHQSEIVTSGGGSAGKKKKSLPSKEDGQALPLGYNKRGEPEQFRALNVGAEVTFELKLMPNDSAQLATPLEAKNVRQVAKYINTRGLDPDLVKYLPLLNKLRAKDLHPSSHAASTMVARELGEQQQQQGPVKEGKKQRAKSSASPPSKKAPNVVSALNKNTPSAAPVPEKPKQRAKSAASAHSSLPSTTKKESTAVESSKKNAAAPSTTTTTKPADRSLSRKQRKMQRPFVPHTVGSGSMKVQVGGTTTTATKAGRKVAGASAGVLPPPPNVSETEYYQLYHQRMSMMNVLMGTPTPDNRGWRNADGSVVYTNYGIPTPEQQQSVQQTGAAGGRGGGGHQHQMSQGGGSNSNGDHHHHGPHSMNSSVTAPYDVDPAVLVSAPAVDGSQQNTHHHTGSFHQFNNTNHHQHHPPQQQQHHDYSGSYYQDPAHGGGYYSHQQEEQYSGGYNNNTGQYGYHPSTQHNSTGQGYDQHGPYTSHDASFQAYQQQGVYDDQQPQQPVPTAGGANRSPSKRGTPKKEERKRTGMQTRGRGRGGIEDSSRGRR